MSVIYTMSSIMCFMLLAGTTIAASLQGSPKMLSALEEKVKSWSGNVQNVPDGKMFMLRKSPTDKSAGFIINATPNNFISSTSSSINDITTPYNPPSSEYENGTDSGANFILFPPISRSRQLRRLVSVVMAPITIMAPSGFSTLSA